MRNTLGKRKLADRAVIIVVHKVKIEVDGLEAKKRVHLLARQVVKIVPNLLLLRMREIICVPSPKKKKTENQNGDW